MEINDELIEKMSIISEKIDKQKIQLDDLPEQLYILQLDVEHHQNSIYDLILKCDKNQKIIENFNKSQLTIAIYAIGLSIIFLGVAGVLSSLNPDVATYICYLYIFVGIIFIIYLHNKINKL